MNRRVAIVIPTLNEAECIGELLGQFSREPADRVVDILVADGGSTDGTRAIVREASYADDRIRLIDNPAIIQAAGINKAAAMARADADTLIRIDAHAGYPYDYVQKILDAFARTGAAMVAVRLNSCGVSARQRGIAAASNSRFGTGGSAHRIGGFSGFVDHGHHAGMDRDMFNRIGGYDESFVANEDAEFDVRVRASGGKIWLAGEIEIAYRPRSSFSALFRQYRRYGQGRAQNRAKHGEALRLRQIAPVVIVGACSSTLALAPALPALLFVPAAYFGVVSIATLALLRRTPHWSTLLAAPAMIVMHWAWGIGFIPQALKSALQQKTGRFAVARKDRFRTRRSY
ncbi:MAG: glycosyltransferase family 2 protein [Sphingorhabdus sp.]